MGFGETLFESRKLKHDLDRANMTSTAESSAAAGLTLLGLPNEIIREIINQADPLNSENLADCRLLIRQLSRDVLLLHEKRKKYQSINVRCCIHPECGQSPLQFLRAIAQDSRVALYPLAISIRCVYAYADEEDEEDEESEDQDMRRDGTPISIKDIGSDILAKEDMWPIGIFGTCSWEWITDLISSVGQISKQSISSLSAWAYVDVKMAVSILLGLCTNLNSLALHDGIWEVMPLLECLHLSGHTLEPSLSRDQAYHDKKAFHFCKLESLEFRRTFASGFEDFDRVGFKQVKLFANLGPLRAIHADYGHPTKMKHIMEPKVWSITDTQLELRGNSMETDDFSVLLRAAQPIESFVYHTGENTMFDRQIAETLDKFYDFAASSLKTLELLGNFRSFPEDDEMLALNLLGFHNLADITLSADLLCLGEEGFMRDALCCEVFLPTSLVCLRVVRLKTLRRIGDSLVLLSEISEHSLKEIIFDGWPAH